MSSPQIIADALTRAGGDKLPAPARAYLFRRLTTQIAGGEPAPTYNLGGLLDNSFGVTKDNSVRGEAAFPDLDTAARALVATSYREAPRDWGALTEKELAQLGSYPLTRKLGEGPTAGDVIKAAVIDLDPSGVLANVYKPSAEAQAKILMQLECTPIAKLHAFLASLKPGTEAESAPRSSILFESHHQPPEPAANLTPRQFLLDIMNDTTVELSLRIDAAKALLPYS
jgi:hypothetical protein